MDSFENFGRKRSYLRWIGIEAKRLRVYNTIQYNTIQYNTIQYNTIQYNKIQYNTIKYNTIQYKNEYYYSGINPVEFRGHSKTSIIKEFAD